MKKNTKLKDSKVGVDGYKSDNTIIEAGTKSPQSVWTGTIRIEMDKKGREMGIYRALPIIRNKYNR